MVKLSLSKKGLDMVIAPVHLSPNFEILKNALAKNIPFLTHHEAVKEIAAIKNLFADIKVIEVTRTKWLGFDIVATYGPPESLSLDSVNKLIKTGREENVTLVIDNLQAGPDFGKELASELGATQVILTNFPGAIPGTETYTKMIEYNARQIFDAI